LTVKDDIRIPPELYEFLRKEHTLLIKGAPGSGKTVLCLDLLKVFAKENTGVYLSSRVPAEVLYEQYPWLKEFSESNNVIASGGLRIEDLTMETVEEFIERLVEVLKEAPNPFVVIDSWDALVKELEPSERIIEEKTVLSAIYSVNGKVVFVMESPEMTSMDYLVDGIVTLRDLDTYNLGDSMPVGVRNLREIEMNKLRGILRSQKKYAFTLQNGRFMCIPSFRGFLPSILLKPTPIFDPNEKMISSGIEDFDTILNGGFEKGSANLIEQGPGVGMHVIHGFLIPIMVNSINLGRGIVMIPSEGFSLDKERYALEAFTDEKALENHLMYITRSSKKQSVENPLQNDNPKVALENLWSIVEGVRRRFDMPVLLLIGMDTLEHMFEFQDLNNFMGEIISRCAESGDIILGYGSQNLKSMGTVGNMASTYWRLNFIHKTLLINGLIPQTDPYAMVPDLSKGFVKIDLIPIV